MSTCRVSASPTLLPANTVATCATSCATSCAPPDAIRIEVGKPNDFYKYSNNSTLGLAFARAFGQDENLIVISSDYPWTGDEMLLVLMHEIAHIILSAHSHPPRGTSILYEYLTGRPARLDWEDMDEVRDRFRQVKPVPQTLAGPYRP